MSVKSYWRKDRQQWEVVVHRRGVRRKKLAPAGMGKREATQVVGDQLIAAIEAVIEETEASPTLWRFSKEVYLHHHGLSPRTWRARQYKVAAVMCDLGDVKMDELTTPMVDDWLEQLRTDGAPLKAGGRGKPLGRSAVNDHLVTLKAMYRVARKRGVLKEIPFDADVEQVPAEVERTTWTKGMVARLFKVALEGDGLEYPGDRRMYWLARFFYATGARPAEALRIDRRADVMSVPARVLMLRGKAQSRPGRGADKAEQYRIRWLPLTGELGDLVAAIQRDLDESDTALFPIDYGPGKGQCYSKWPQKRWEALCAAAKVPSAPYDLRHTFITERVAEGVPLALVAQWSGNSVRVIEERYAHLQPAHLESVNDRPRDAKESS